MKVRNIVTVGPSAICRRLSTDLTKRTTCAVISWSVCLYFVGVHLASDKLNRESQHFDLKRPAAFTLSPRRGFQHCGLRGREATFKQVHTSQFGANDPGVSGIIRKSDRRRHAGTNRPHLSRISTSGRLTFAGRVTFGKH